MNEQDFSKIIGKPLGNQSVSDFLSSIGIQERNIKIKRGDDTVAVEAEAFGIGASFSIVEATPLAEKEEFPEGTLILVAVFMFNEGIQGHKKFSGTLPNQLEFEHSREFVRKNLGEPTWSSPILPIDRWSFVDYKLVIQFNDDGTKIELVTIQLPK